MFALARPTMPNLPEPEGELFEQDNEHGPDMSGPYTYGMVDPLLNAQTDMRPGGYLFDPQFPNQGPGVIMFAGSPTETAMHDIAPPEVRAMPEAVRRYPRIRMKGDSSGVDRIEPRRSWLGWTSDWDQNHDGGRPIRRWVTDMQNPNPGGGAEEWGGAMGDPSDMQLRQPGVTDWWL